MRDLRCLRERNRSVIGICRIPEFGYLQFMTMESTRQALHGVAELVMSGPQYRRSGTIRLRVVPGGFCTVAEPGLRVDGGQLVGDDVRLAMSVITYSELAAAVGVTAGAPEGLYHEGSGVKPGDVVEVDQAAAVYLAECFALGDAALRRMGGEPVLWPEHFDLAITLDEVNFGVSPGDGYLAEPYAYVGPWQLREGAFWNAPFGAAQRLEGLDLDGFFAEGRSLTA